MIFEAALVSEVVVLSADGQKGRAWALRFEAYGFRVGA